MPIKVLEQQRRTYEIGRIRIGVQVPTSKPGRTRPAKLDVFRFTSRDEHAVRAVADLYGGEVRQWDGAPTDDQWEVVTTAREIGVTVPPGPQSVSQWMEMWSGGGCVRRCDGEREQLRGVACLCDPAAAPEDRCRPTTRVSLVLPDVPGLGVWRLESKGWNAAHEMGGTAEFLAAVREAGAWVPAVLRLEKRKQVVGGKTHQFAVPVLTLRQTVRAMLEGPRTGGIELPPPPAMARAIEAAPTAPAAPDGGRVAAPWPPTCAQDVAVHVEACTDLRRLDEITRGARQAGLMDEFVDSRFAPVEGEAIELVEVFRGRQAELNGGGA